MSAQEAFHPQEIMRIDNINMSLVEMVREIFKQAINIRAKIILIFLKEDSFVINMFTGTAEHLISFSDPVHYGFIVAMIGRIKIISSMIISMYNLPQVRDIRLDGMPPMTVVVLPGKFGESVVIHLSY